MSYLVLARKWRPQTFDDVVGQGHVTRTLQNAIRSDRVAHAFLFCGMRGVGKTTAARLLAKALNCEKGPAPTPCNACSNCREITAGNAVDVLEIDGASNRGINEVRQIIENVRYRPAKSRFKIYIIDEVHQVTHDAFNALLKTLEEPPEHVKFIFATTEAHKVPHTILSRCQRYDFKRISLRQIAERLREICKSDGIAVSEPGLLMVAREAEGSMRDAQSLLDQVIAFAGKKIQDADVITALGVADRQILYAVGAAVVERHPAKAIERLGELHLFGYDLRRFARELLEHIRNWAVAKLDDSDALLADLSDEEHAEVRRQAECLSAADVDRAFRIVLATEEEVARSPYPKLVLEMAVLKLATMPAVLPIEHVLERLEALSRRGPSDGGQTGGGPAAASGGGGAPTARSASVRAQPESGRSPATSVAGSNGGASSWNEFLSYIEGQKPTLAPHLSQCHCASLEDGRLELVVPVGFHHDYLARREHIEMMEEFASRFYGKPIRVAMKTSQPTPRREEKPAADKAQLTQEVMGDPAVRAVVDILGGEVQDVKSRTPTE